MQRCYRMVGTNGDWLKQRLWHREYPQQPTRQGFPQKSQSHPPKAENSARQKSQMSWTIKSGITSISQLTSRLPPPFRPGGVQRSAQRNFLKLVTDAKNTGILAVSAIRDCLPPRHSRETMPKGLFCRRFAGDVCGTDSGRTIEKKS